MDKTYKDLPYEKYKDLPSPPNYRDIMNKNDTKLFKNKYKELKIKLPYKYVEKGLNILWYDGKTLFIDFIEINMDSNAFGKLKPDTQKKNLKFFMSHVAQLEELYTYINNILSNRNLV